MRDSAQLPGGDQRNEGWGTNSRDTKGMRDGAQLPGAPKEWEMGHKHGQKKTIVTDETADVKKK